MIRFIRFHIVCTCLIWLTVSFTSLYGQSAGNLPPYDSLLHKTYAQNSLCIAEIKQTLFQMDTIQSSAWFNGLRLAAIQSSDKLLELQACCLRTEIISDKRKKACTSNADLKQVIKQVIEEHKQTYEQAGKYGNIPMQLNTLYWIAELYENDLKNPGMAAEYFGKMKNLLPQITVSQFPYKAIYCYQVGENYYLFKDYDRAIVWFRQAIANPLPSNTTQDIHSSSRNTIGLIYLGCNMPDSAEVWFRSVIDHSYRPDLKNVHKGIYKAIGQANLGKAYHQQGKDDEAIALLETGSATMIQEMADYGFAIGCYITLADIYVKRKDWPRTRQYFELAYEYIRKTGQTRHLTELYRVESRYYTYTGQPTLAVTLTDSAFNTRVAAEKDYNALLLMRVEQKEAAQKQQQKEEELLIEKTKRQNAQKSILIFSVALIIICSLLVVVFIFYRRKRRAYQALVERIRQWAQAAARPATLYLPKPEVVDVVYEEIKVDPASDKPAVEPDDTDRFLFDQLQQLILQEQIYHNPGITLEETARRLKINRTYLSQAINRCSGKNFNAYINEYRILKAVTLMSGNTKKLSLEGVAIESGFNDRKTFYTAFKKITGLSPSEFRNNLPKG